MQVRTHNATASLFAALIALSPVGLYARDMHVRNIDAMEEEESSLNMGTVLGGAAILGCIGGGAYGWHQLKKIGEDRDKAKKEHDALANSVKQLSTAIARYNENGEAHADLRQLIEGLRGRINQHHPQVEGADDAVDGDGDGDGDDDGVGDAPADGRGDE